jgi:hypothetical protein
MLILAVAAKELHARAASAIIVDQGRLSQSKASKVLGNPPHCGRRRSQDL